MPRDADLYDVFVSYARADNGQGWITQFVGELVAAHHKFTGGRELSCFFDQREIGSLDDWRHRIYGSLARSRLFLAFLSPRYFASPWCRREWRAWIDTEIAKHVLSSGAAPIYIVEVPGFDGPGDEQEVARQVARLCELPPPHEAFARAAAPVVKQLRRRQFNAVQPFYRAGLDALRRGDLRHVLEKLARELDERAEMVRRAAESETTVPPYNRHFSGRLDELLLLREQLQDDRAGVISGVHGLGGVGKTELAFTYAHAFGAAYRGGRFLVPCEGRSRLRDALPHLGETPAFRPHISDEARKTPEAYLAAVIACLHERLERLGHVLLVLDNVTDVGLLAPDQTDLLTALGPHLHLPATTRLPPAGAGRIHWTMLGELPEDDALELLEKHRPLPDDAQREAGRRIVRRLGGFMLAVELVAAWLAAHPGVSCADYLARLGLEDLEALDAAAADPGVELRRHDHERRLEAVLGPTLERIGAECPAARRALEYAALLPADYVALPWLRELVAGDDPAVGKPARPGYDDPWDAVCRALEKYALISRSERTGADRDLDAEPGDAPDRRLVRVHRLVQDLERRKLDQQGALAARQQAVTDLVRRRAAALQKETHWIEAGWELDPLEATAQFWDETGHSKAAWLLNSAGLRLRDIAQWNRAEPLLRRALAIFESSYPPDHPEVARSLNNLAQLLQATNRLAEAEPLMRRALAIDESSYGPDHPEVATDLNNLALLLQETDRLAEAEPLSRRAVEILRRFEADTGHEHPNLRKFTENHAAIVRRMGS